jgi:hypothetical protein
MDREKELLKQDLDNQEKPEEIKKFIEDAQMLGHEDVAELGRQKLLALEERVKEISKTSGSQMSQMNNLGGSNEELNKRTEEIDQKIKETKEGAEKEIKGVEGQENQEKIKTLYEQALEKRKSGIEMFNALLASRGEEAVEKKMQELWHHPTDSSGRKIEGLNTASENLEYFSRDIGYINDKSKLEEIYPYYESQTSNRYIGKLLVSIDGLAFAQGFNTAYLNKKNGTEIDSGDISDSLKYYIKLAEEISKIDKRKREEYSAKINNSIQNKS